jgi:hypothetical protein
MIDTVILSIPLKKVQMLEPIASGTEQWDLQAKRSGYRKFVKNPTERELATGLYFPLLTAHRRKIGAAWVEMVDIQFSAPKLLYRNNLDELTEAAFEEIIIELADRLQRMGIIAGRQVLRDAEVRAVHYSKNIEIRGGFTAQYVIDELSKINANKRLDTARARFVNEGQSLYFHATTHEIVFYDKVADLAKGTRRAIDKDQTLYQTSLFEQLDGLREVLRLEVRLSAKRKMNALFVQLGFNQNPTFREVFSQEKSQKVLMHYWDTMLAKNARLLFAASHTPEDLLKQILVVRKGARSRTAIYLAGLILVVQTAGIRGLRSALGKKCGNRTWARVAADLRALEVELSGFDPRDWYEQAQMALSTYQPIRIKGS